MYMISYVPLSIQSISNSLHTKVVFDNKRLSIFMIFYKKNTKSFSLPLKKFYISHFFLLFLKQFIYKLTIHHIFYILAIYYIDKCGSVTYKKLIEFSILLFLSCFFLQKSTKKKNKPHSLQIKSNNNNIKKRLWLLRNVMLV